MTSSQHAFYYTKKRKSAFVTIMTKIWQLRQHPEIWCIILFETMCLQDHSNVLKSEIIFSKFLFPALKTFSPHNNLTPQIQTINPKKIFESWANPRKGLPLNLRGIEKSFFLGRLHFLFFEVVFIFVHFFLEVVFIFLIFFLRSSSIFYFVPFN